MTAQMVRAVLFSSHLLSNVDLKPCLHSLVEAMLSDTAVIPLTLDCMHPGGTEIQGGSVCSLPGQNWKSTADADFKWDKSQQ